MIQSSRLDAFLSESRRRLQIEVANSANLALFLDDPYRELRTQEMLQASPAKLAEYLALDASPDQFLHDPHNSLDDLIAYRVNAEIASFYVDTQPEQNLASYILAAHPQIEVEELLDRLDITESSLEVDQLIDSAASIVE